MNKYSATSKKSLKSCNGDLQVIFQEVLKNFDHSVLCGYRGEKAQTKAFEEGKSKLEYPESKHNTKPSLAIDAAPYPIDWEDKDRMRYFAGYVKGTADLLYTMGIVSKRIRWGGDWDKDTDLNDQTFDDLVHFELIENGNI